MMCMTDTSSLQGPSSSATAGASCALGLLAMRVFTNCSRAILHDETVFPESGRFKPERFLTADSKPNNTPFPDAVFGFGRRICPGRYMAREAVWIAVVSVLARFNISKALDEDGNEVETTDKYASGFIS